MRHGLRTSAADDFYTPPETITPLVRVLSEKGISKVWEPAAGQSHIANVLRCAGMSVTESDIIHGLEYDFRHIPPPDGIEAIVTNPPFSLTVAFVERCIQIGLPWALLLPLQKLDTRRMRELMHEAGVSLFIVKGRPKWILPDGTIAVSGYVFAWYTCGLIVPRSLRFMEAE